MRIIAGEYRGRSIKTGKGPGYRPATGKVREALFSMLESMGVFWPDMRVLDLFAGSGSLGLEALSRGAKKSFFVEQELNAARLLLENIKNLGISEKRAELRRQNALCFLNKQPELGFDLIFIDPPYGLNMLQKALPKVIEHSWLLKEGLLCAEVEGSLLFRADDRHELEMIKDKKFGQTRILLWKRVN